MPTYVYACKACQHQFEKFQSFTANALRTCPNCGEKALSKVIFPAGVVFKGSGFYVNDSKDTPKTKSPSTESAKSDSSSGDESSGKDSGDSKKKDDSSSKKPKSSPDKKPDKKTDKKAQTKSA